MLNNHDIEDMKGFPQPSANDKQIGGEIPLTRGLAALVDPEMVEILSQFSWCACVPKGSSGYAMRFDGTNFVYMHRVIMEASKEQLVDHINGNTLDNRKENLRFANKSQNASNTVKSRGKSKYKGVWYQPSRKKPWKAELTHNNTKFSLGSYATEEEAALAYNKMAVQLFGEFAMENKIEC